MTIFGRHFFLSVCMETFSFILGKFLLSPLEGEKYFVVFINLNRIVILYLFGNWKILLDVIYCFKLEWFWILFIVFSLWRKQHCPPTWNDPNAKQNIEWQITQAASFISNPIQQSVGVGCGQANEAKRCILFCCFMSFTSFFPQ